jgi:hypothetical protein
VAEWTDPMTDEERKQAVIDLLGVLAYAELTAFERLAADASLAPTIADKAALGGMAVAEFGHFQVLHDRLDSLGVDPAVAMEPFVGPLDAYHDSTTPADWLEGLVKAYVGDGFAADFYRELAEFMDDATQSLVVDVLDDTGHAEFAVAHVRSATEADPAVAGRLALWGRRLVGEALSQAQRVAADRDALTSLLTGTVDRPGLDLAAVSRMFSRLIENHTRRMATLGLQA